MISGLDSVFVHFSSGNNCCTQIKWWVYVGGSHFVHVMGLSIGRVKVCVLCRIIIVCVLISIYKMPGVSITDYPLVLYVFMCF